MLTEIKSEVVVTSEKPEAVIPRVETGKLAAEYVLSQGIDGKKKIECVFVDRDVEGVEKTPATEKANTEKK